MARLAAVITAYNRADFVDKCMRSVLEAETPDLQIRVIVMDNGSSDNTAEVAQAVEGDITVLRTEDNRHIVEVINRGFEAAFAEPRADYIIVMNEDTEFTPGSLGRLVAAAEEYPNSIFTPLQRNYREPEHVDDNAYGHLASVRELVEDAVLGRPLKTVYPLPTIIGAAMFARRDVWENLGEFDPLFWFYGIDDDLCTRARWLGYGVLLAPASHLYHAHGKLDSEVQQQTKEARYRKWRNELQARYLFRLKDPNKPLARCAVETLFFALGMALTCLRAPWPRGAAAALAIYFDCIKNYGAIHETRQRHFDPARRLGEPCQRKGQ